MNKLGGSQFCINGKSHYERNKEYYLIRNKIQRKEIREFVIKAKNKPCMDCSKSYPFYVMGFDHRPGGIKKFDIAQAATHGYSVKTLKEEIAKCDIVCANCHAIRTHKRRMV